MIKSDRISLINSVLKDYFSNPQNPRKIQAKDMMPLFIQKGVFASDNKKGLPLRKLLRDLDEHNQLSTIPFVHAERKTKNTNWYFMANASYDIEKDVRNIVKVKDLSSNDNVRSRNDSDEYYVVELCNKVLNRAASQQHKFDFLCGDNGYKLPVDAYYEDLNLVIEYYERQHTESVKLFDNRMTISGVTRGEQRKIYDERRRRVLPEHGIKLIVIDYSDFGTTRKLSRNPNKDIEVIKRILSENGVI